VDGSHERKRLAVGNGASINLCHYPQVQDDISFNQYSHKTSEHFL
jgi:hypothetical protein